MAKVDTIKEELEVIKIGETLEEYFGSQLKDIWNVGTHIPLGISTLLSMRYDDIHEGRLRMFRGDSLNVIDLKLTPYIATYLERMREDNPDHVYVFQSHRNRQSINRSPQPISRRYVSRALEKVGEIMGYRLGTQSMRKTLGYRFFTSTGDLTKTMAILGKRTDKEALEYIDAEGAVGKETNEVDTIGVSTVAVSEPLAYYTNLQLCRRFNHNQKALSHYKDVSDGLITLHLTNLDNESLKSFLVGEFVRNKINAVTAIQLDYLKDFIRDGELTVIAEDDKEKDLFVFRLACR